MTEWLVHTFVKDYKETHRSDVRFSYSRLTSLTGIFCNLLLFAVKGAAGIISGSIAILSDAVNNLTDCFSCIVSLVGNKAASKPADPEHPFGHGRIEYIVSLTTAALIFTAAYELFTGGIAKILNPAPLRFSWVMFVILAATILVKAWMARFNRTLGDRLDHPGMKAAAADSVNDVLATSFTLLAMVLALKFPNVPFDGVMGSLVALYIAWGGVQLSKEIIGKLIGNEPDQALLHEIEQVMEENPQVLGVHDIILHDYGAGNRIGSAHAELPSDLSLQDAHDIIDACEKKVEEMLHVKLTIHPDPSEVDETTAKWKQMTAETVNEIVPGATIHDFQVRKEMDNIGVRFDVNLPFDCVRTSESIWEEIQKQLAEKGINGPCEITFDRGYFSERSK